MSATLLIANRGEIALRIIRTATELELCKRSPSTPRTTPTARTCTRPTKQSVCPAPVRDAYLDHAAMLAAAKKSGAELIHPGYGFLSENAEFARACASAGYTFVGPDADALDTVRQ